jgi:hypothetical protein
MRVCLDSRPGRVPSLGNSREQAWRGWVEAGDLGVGD